MLEQKGNISLFSLIGSIVSAITLSIVSIVTPLKNQIVNHFPTQKIVSTTRPSSSFNSPTSKPDGTTIYNSKGNTLNVGYQIRKITYSLPSGGSKPLTYAVWYPTKSPMSYYNYNRRIAPGGMVALNSPLFKNASSTGYPLIVFSHGAGGCGTIYSYINSYLASNGYIVAAPDHEDALVCSINNEAGLKQTKCNNGSTPSSNNTCNRPADINAVISDMLSQNSLSSSPFYGSINSAEIGVAGHSAGGLTVMQVSGLEPTDKNPAVKAALMLAADTGVYPSSSYAQMNIPVMFEIGKLDKNSVSSQNTPRDVPFLGASYPKFLTVNKYDFHLAFDDTVCEGYSTINDCDKNNSRAREIITLANSFLNYALKNNSDSASFLLSANSKSNSVCLTYQLSQSPLVNPQCLNIFSTTASASASLSTRRNSPSTTTQSSPTSAAIIRRPRFFR